VSVLMQMRKDWRRARSLASPWPCRVGVVAAVGMGKECLRVSGLC
jgi:hypothetical protein